MRMKRHIASFFIMIFYSLPLLAILGLVGHWLGGAAGAWFAVGLFGLAMFAALAPPKRVVAKA